MDYNARFYNAALGRFIQPDSIVPGISSQALNRYMYVMGNPINFKDPSGNKFIEDDMFDDPLKENDKVGFMYGGFPDTTKSKHFNNDLLLLGGDLLIEDGFDLTLDYSGDENNDLARKLLQEYITEVFNNTNASTNEIQASAVEFAILIGADIEDLIAVLSGHGGAGWDITNPFHDMPIDSIYNTYIILEVDENRMGMNSKYADPLIDFPVNNQVHHIWFYVQVGYYSHGMIMQVMGNLLHEYFSDEGGQSKEDFDAGIWGGSAGYNVYNGYWDLYDLSNNIRNELGN